MTRGVYEGTVGSNSANGRGESSTCYSSSFGSRSCGPERGFEMRKPIFETKHFIDYVEHDFQAENCADIANEKTASLMAEAVKLSEHLSEALNYVHFRADDLVGDDIIGDKRHTKRHNELTNSLEKALASFLRTCEIRT